MAAQKQDDERSPGEDEPMDEQDFKILRIIDELHTRHDPMPSRHEKDE